MISFHKLANGVEVFGR